MYELSLKVSRWYRYGELEEVSFGESLAAVMLPEIGEDLDSAVSSLSAFAAATESALSSALARCQQATGAQIYRWALAEPSRKACTFSMFRT